MRNRLLYGLNKSGHKPGLYMDRTCNYQSTKFSLMELADEKAFVVMCGVEHVYVRVWQ